MLTTYLSITLCIVNLCIYVCMYVCIKVIVCVYIGTFIIFVMFPWSDMTVLTDVKLSSSAAHAIAERTRFVVMDRFPQEVLDVLVIRILKPK